MLENIFNWVSKKPESAHSPDIATGGSEPESGIDITIPMFHFTVEERAGMKEKGMSDEEIDMKERGIINKLARERNN